MRFGLSELAILTLLDRATNARIDSWLPKALDFAALTGGQSDG